MNVGGDGSSEHSNFGTRESPHTAQDLLPVPH